MKLALLVANRGFFPSKVILSAYDDMRCAAKEAGIELLEIDPSQMKYGSVETTRDGAFFAQHLAAHSGEYDGVIVCLPNFGDENGIKAALRDIQVPVLIQAYPDVPGEMDFANRRDAFCGKLGLCSVLKQTRLKFTAGQPFVMHPLSAEFAKELHDFVRICRVVRGMRHARIGMIGARTTAFKSVRFDEAALEACGIDVETYDLSQLFDRMDQLDERAEDIPLFTQKLAETTSLSYAPAYAQKNLAKLGAALERFVADMELDTFALRCWSELQHRYKITPCSVLGLFNQAGISAACEADVTTVVMMHVLHLASGLPAGCLDLNNNYGSDPDKAVLFHCGPLPMDLMEAKGSMQEHKMFVKTQGENCSWGLNVGRIKPGPVTIAGCRTENGQVRYFVISGEVTKDTMDEGYFGTYGVVRVGRLQDKLVAMADEGFRHHVVIVRGNHIRAVTEALNKYLGYTQVPLE